MGPSSLAIVAAAEKRKIPWRRLGTGSLIELGYGKNRRRVQTAVSGGTSHIAVELVQNKAVTKTILGDSGVRTPRGFTARTEEGVREGIEDLEFPLVAKPVDGHHGNGVTMNIGSIEELLQACEAAWKYSSRVLVEEQISGRDYRLLVIGGRLIAAAERTPAHVVGDGVNTIEELVRLANLDPRRGTGHANVLTQISIDEAAVAYLARGSRTLQTIPASGEVVHLVATANLSTGGTAKDVTDEVHESVRLLAERTARIVDLDICGIDLIHEDISQPATKKTSVIEVNAGPGLRMHVAPSEGKPRDVGGAIVDMLYPAGQSARIPILSVTGTNGKTTTSRLLAHICGMGGAVVGLTTSDGILVGGKLIEKGDTTGPNSARMILNDPSIEIAVLETARGGIMRRGLGYDWSDVGVITNIRPDHIGQDGLEDISDLVRVKSLIADRVRDGGTMVLNADDHETSRLISHGVVEKGARNVTYFTLRPESDFIREHLRNGGTAFAAKNGWIFEMRSNLEVAIAPIAEIPITIGGTAAYQIANALAAAAAARAVGHSIDEVRRGLLSFDVTANTGRSNIYRVGKGVVVLDYGHNPDAIRMVGEMVKSWLPLRTKAVMGLPGDRSNSMLEESARAAAASFDELILRNDHDRRGRNLDEIPNLIANVCEREFPNVRYRKVSNDKVAIDLAISELEQDEVAVIFFDKFDPAMTALRQHDPQPVTVNELLRRKTELRDAPVNARPFATAGMPNQK